MDDATQNEPSEPLDELLARAVQSSVRVLRRRSDSGLRREPQFVDARPEEAPELPESLDRYRVEYELGRGGVGIVYRIADDDLNRSLAIKVLRPSLASDPSFRAQFDAEARLCASLEHPGIVPVHEVGRLTDGRPFFTMRLVHGQTLLRAMRSEGSKRPRRLIPILIKACEAVAYAHDRGIAHGDLKPENIMVGEFGEVQTMDWGFAQSFADESPGEHRARVVGTPAYMAPELARGQLDQLRPTCDVFALGAILVFLITGRPLYEGETKNEIFEAAYRGDTAAATTRLAAVRGVDRHLAKLALRCIDPDPDRRPQNGAQLASALESVLDAIETRTRRLRATLLATIVIVICAGWAALGWVYVSESSRHAAFERTYKQAVEQTETSAEVAASSVLDVENRRSVLMNARRALNFAHAAGKDDDEIRRRHLAVDRAEEDLKRANRIAGLLRWCTNQRADFTIRYDQTYFDRMWSNVFSKHGLPLQAVGADVEKTAAKLKAYGIDRELALALEDWAWIRRRATGNYRSAERLMTLAISLDPNELRARVRSAAWSRDMPTLTELAQQVENREANPASWALLARSYYQVNERDIAISLLDRGLAIYPMNVELRLTRARLARSRSQSCDWNRVIDDLEAAAHIEPSVGIRTELAYALYQGNRLAEARALLTTLRNEHTTDSRVFRIAAAVELAAKDYAACAKHANSAVQLDPNEHDSLRMLGVAEKRLGRWDDAEFHLRNAVRLSGHDQALRALGSLLLERGHRYEAAVYLKRARRLSPTSPALRHALSKALAYEGDFEGAIQELTVAIKHIELHHPETDTRSAQEWIPFLDRARRLAPIVAQCEIERDYGPLENISPIAVAFTAYATDHDDIAIEYFRRVFDAYQDQPWRSSPLRWVDAISLAAERSAREDDDHTFGDLASEWLHRAASRLASTPTADCIQSAATLKYNESLSRARAGTLDVKMSDRARQRWDEAWKKIDSCLPPR